MLHFIEKFSNLKLPFLTTLQICLDLGTTNTRIAIKDKGVVLQEPTYLGLNKKVHEYIFFGQEAKRIVGKVPEFIKIVKPVVNGIISEFDAQVALIQNFIQKGVAPYMVNYPFIKPPLDAIVAVPSIATEIEQKAVEEVLLKLGVRKVFLIERPLATAMGCGFNIFMHKPVFVVDLGGGLIEMAVISGGGIVMQKTLRTAGDHMNKLIYNYIHLKHGLILGEATCEELKVRLLNFTNEEKTMMVRGKSLENGLPKSVKIRTSDIKEALLSQLNLIIDTVKEIIELSPPEVVDEIFNRGIVLTGGLSNISGIDAFFTEELKNIKVSLAENRDLTTISGLMRIGRRKDLLQRLKIQLP
ncbi:rod shape-determining protein [Candidatus Roizmanbacteria bacterium]|nr:rod shape-determining protein [Candidatus Roizmanbacteria bacterium]